jgi:hypothetical protein
MNRGRRRRARGFTAIELAVAFAVVGSLAAVAVPAFLRNLTASRFVEPTRGLAAIASGAVAYAVGHGGTVGAPSMATAFPHTVGLTPSPPPRGELTADRPGIWNDPSWVDLGFPDEECARLVGPDVPHAVSFAFDSTLGAPRSSFLAHAHGDLDGDGTTSTFEVRGHATSREGAVVEPGMYVEAPLE